MSARHWKTLYAASHVISSRAQISNLCRLPLVRREGVDSVDFIFDLFSNQPGQLINIRAVDWPRMLKLHDNFLADSSGMRMQHNNPIRQSNRFTHRMRDE